MRLDGVGDGFAKYLGEGSPSVALLKSSAARLNAAVAFSRVICPLSTSRIRVWRVRDRVAEG